MVVRELDIKIMSILQKIFFFKRYLNKSVSENKLCSKRFKGLWSKINKEAISLTGAFFEENIRPKVAIVDCYNKLLHTSKFATFIKQQLCRQICSMLEELHLIRNLSLTQTTILVSNNSINTFVLNYFEMKYNVRLNVRYVSSRFNLLILLTYYVYMILDMGKRGFVFNKRRVLFKLSKESTWGFHNRAQRDDVIIDHRQFMEEDLLLFEMNPCEPTRVEAFQEARKRNFHTVSVPRLSLNIRRNIFNLLFFYFVVPFRVYFQLAQSRQAYLFYIVWLFHKRCLPAEILMNLYEIKCNISMVDHGDIETTIIFNKYGTKNVIFQWSDLTYFHDHSLAFIAHNIYFAWGDIHYDYHSEHYCVDKKINVGCIYKQWFTQALRRRSELISDIEKFKSEWKTVVFFDDCGMGMESTLEFLELMKEFCERNGNVNVLLKPRNMETLILQKLRGRDILSYKNFTCLDPKEWSAEDAIAVSDVCVNMTITTPVTVALICGKNALYFDNTGNYKDNPLAEEHFNELIFEDRDAIFRQIGSILTGRFSCRSVISEKDLRRYDAFNDDKAIERVRNYLSELVSKN